MTTQPANYPDFATNANYTTGPNIGQPNKVALDVGLSQEGYLPNQRPSPLKWNWWGNLVGQWIRYLAQRPETFLVRGGTSNVTGSYTVPDWAQTVEVELIAGGGGGGAGNDIEGAGAGGGGGSGRRFKRTYQADDLRTAFGSSVLYQVGKAGAGGLASGANGTAGGDTYFGKALAQGGSAGTGGGTTTGGAGGAGACGGGGGAGPTPGAAGTSAIGAVASAGSTHSGGFGGDGKNVGHPGGGGGGNSESTPGGAEYGESGRGYLAANDWEFDRGNGGNSGSGYDSTPDGYGGGGAGGPAADDASTIGLPGVDGGPGYLLITAY
jgi:hypothetical protein